MATESRADRRKIYEALLRCVRHQSGGPQPLMAAKPSVVQIMTAGYDLDADSVRSAIRAAVEHNDLIEHRGGLVRTDNRDRLVAIVVQSPALRVQTGAGRPHATRTDAGRTTLYPPPPEPPSMRTSRFDFATVDVAVTSDGERRDARLYRPDRPRRPPVVVAAPGVLPASVGLPTYAERLAAAGWAVLVVDRGDRLDPAARLADWRAAVATVRDRDDLRGRNPALFGMGLAGGLALALSAEDPRIRAVLAHDPVVDGGALLAARPPRDRLAALGAAVRDRVGAPLGRGVTAPVCSGVDGRAAFVGTDAADLVRLAPEGWRNETPARALLSLRRFAVDLGDVDAPTLLVGSRDGDYVPARVGDVAGDLRRPTTVELPASHDEFYRRPERVAGHDVAFLAALE